MKASKDYNRYPIKFILCLLVSLLTLSCQNSLINNKTSCTVSLNEEIKDVIKRTSSFTDDTVFSVEGILYSKDKEAIKKETNSTLDNLDNVSFDFTDIPFGSDYKIKINLIKDDDLIYQATSAPISLTEDNPLLVLDLTVEPVTKHIKYVLNGGSFNKRIPETYSIMHSVYLIEPVLENSEFLGWYLNEDFSGEKITVLNKDNYYGDVTLYAAWRGFDTLPTPLFTHKGNAINEGSYDVDKGDTIIINNSFDKGSKVYYTVDGTNPNSTNGILYIPNTPLTITKNQTIKAITMEDGYISSSVATIDLNLKTYNIRYDNGGYGTTPDSVLNKYKGDTIKLPPSLTEPTYHFTHWDVGGIDKNPGENITIDDSLISKAVNGDITIRACWEGVVENVTFSVTGSVDKGDTVSLSCGTLDATIYYTTNGSEPSSSSTKYDGTPIPINTQTTIKAFAMKSSMKASNITESTYTIKTYEIRFDNAGHGTAPNALMSKVKGDTIQLPLSLTEPGFHFTHWDVGGVNKNPEENITIDDTLISKAISGVITITACWEGVVEDVTFSVKGDVDKGDKVILSCGTLGATIYYTTNGQSPSTSSNVYSTSIPINNNQTIKAIAVKNGMKDSNVTTADYNVKTYTITFDSNGHGTSPSSVSGLMKGDLVPTPEELTDSTSGFTCTQEWYKEKECKNMWNFNSSTVTSSIILYAKWTDIAPSPISNFTASLDSSKTKIQLNWDNPSESDIDKIEIKGVDANYSEQIVKSGNKQSCTVTLDTSTVGKGTYNFTAVVNDKGKHKSSEVNCSIELPVFDDFSIPNGRENSKYSVYVTGRNFTKNNLTSSDFKLKATSNAIVPTNLVIDSDTELHFDIPSSTAKTDEITINVVGAAPKKANVEIKAQYNISDIVMTDGSILTSEKLTNYRGKAEPVATIFREKTPSLPALGVGLYAKRCDDWSPQNLDLTTINDNSDSDTDGRDNWGKVQQADPTGSADAATNYPAFDFSNNYGKTYYSGTQFESNWYLPTTKEIMLLADSIPTYNAFSDSVIAKFPLKPDQRKFGQGTNCWSSTQNGSTKVNTYWFPHNTKRSEQKPKNGNTEGLCAIAMRPFD